MSVLRSAWLWLRRPARVAIHMAQPINHKLLAVGMIETMSGTGITSGRLG